MNEKEIADRLRRIYIGELPDTEIERIADELDPPTPKPGTPILYQLRPWEEWQHGIGCLGDDGNVYIQGMSPGFKDPSLVEWKHARVVGNDEMVVSKTLFDAWYNLCRHGTDWNKGTTAIHSRPYIESATLAQGGNNET